MKSWYSETDLPLCKETIVVEETIEHGVRIGRKLMEGQRVPPNLIGAYLAATGQEPVEETPDYSKMSVEDLQALADERDVEAFGTGKDGNVLKVDLVAALKTADASEGAE